MGILQGADASLWMPATVCLLGGFSDIFHITKLVRLVGRMGGRGGLSAPPLGT